MAVFKKIAGWLLVALSLLVLVSSMSLLLRGSDDTFPHLPPDQFAALLAGRLAAIILPLVVGIFLLKEAKKTEQQPSTIPNTEESLSGHAASDAWQTAITFIPDTKKIYDQLHNIDPEHAEKFKSDRLRLKDFSNAQHEYWRLLNQIAEEACGTTNPNSRAFLLSAINNGDYESARRFIALAKVLGAANMNGDILAKFKSSTEKNTSIEAAIPTKSKRTQRRDLEFDDG